jgi:hypothetical protein
LLETGSYADCAEPVDIEHNNPPVITLKSCNPRSSFKR